MLSNFLGVLPILISPLCALALSCDQSQSPCCAKQIFNWYMGCTLVLEVLTDFTFMFFKPMHVV
jgi:hypothetical protein